MFIEIDFYPIIVGADSMHSITYAATFSVSL